MTIKHTRAFINGIWHSHLSSFPIINPATLEPIAEVVDAGTDLARAALDAAAQALPTWRSATAYERARILRRAYELMLERGNELAKVMTLEMGKPIREARSEVTYAANFVEWFAEEAKRIYGETIPANVPNKRLSVLKQPVGVVVAITPWNFPAAMVTRKVAPALAAGCTVVLKPAEQSPLTALALAAIFQEAGLPEGVLNMVPTHRASEVGSVLLGDERVRMITFTGSEAVGQILMRQAADHIVKVSLELGGHAPFIVFEDADLQRAAEGLVASKFRNSGQTCICTNRVYVQESVLAEFLKRFVPLVQALRVGDVLKEETEIGPLVDEQGYKKVEMHVQDAVSKGASLVTGGKGNTNNGYFFEPTILTNVDYNMRIMAEETFGPVVPVMSFKTEEEAIKHANNSPYGLSAYFYSEDISRATRVSEALEFGIIGINDPLPTTLKF